MLDAIVVSREMEVGFLEGFKLKLNRAGEVRDRSEGVGCDVGDRKGFQEGFTPGLGSRFGFWGRSLGVKRCGGLEEAEGIGAGRKVGGNAIGVVASVITKHDAGFRKGTWFRQGDVFV